LKLQKESEERILLYQALEIAGRLLAELKKTPGVLRAEIAGSIRRRKETIGDIDLLVSCRPVDRKKIVARFVSLKECQSVLAKGETKASILVKDYNRQADLRIVNDNEWGSALLYFTGSKEHTIRLRTLAKERGLKLNEYGVFRAKDEKYIVGKTEEEIYKLLGFAWVPPEMRENTGELALAAKNKIPLLVTGKQLKGDMQMHSDWSDGKMKIGEIVQFICKEFRYEYIVLTDHSQSQRLAGGMTEKEFLQQGKEIKKINTRLGRNFVKCGAEVDILLDGSLDLDDALLAKLDWVCASIHSGFSRDNTDRLIAACENRYVNCIGHPTGRLIGKREAYRADWQKVFRAAAQTGTALEINAQPDRMDLNSTLARQAREAGVMLTISTDSHTKENFYYMDLGISIARRAWCTANDILNTRSWKDVQRFAKNKITGKAGIK
jgi:DNA polymerase (family 10)